MSLPSTSQRNRNIPPTKKNSVDVGKPLGVYDTNSVRDRVRQWQSQGGGVVHADDVGARDELESSPAKSRTPKDQPTTPSGSDKGLQSDFTLSQDRRRKSKRDEDFKNRSRSGSAPAKRIVSDAHWRKKRDSPKNTSSPKSNKDDTSKPVVLDEGIRVRPTSYSKSSEQRTLEDERQFPITKSADCDDAFRKHRTSSGSRGYTKPPRRRRKSEHPGSERNSGSDSEGQSRSPSVPKSTGQRNFSFTEEPQKLSSSSAENPSTKRRSSTYQSPDYDGSPVAARGSLTDGKGSVRSRKGGLLSQVFGDSRRRSTKQVPETIPPRRVPSIEAWLDETPDPFIDTDTDPVDIVPPLRLSADKRRSKPQEEPAVSPNDRWEGPEQKRIMKGAVSGSRKKKRIPSSAIYEDNPFPDDFDSDSALSGSGRGSASAPKFVDLVQGGLETSPPSLKRRSARKSISSPVRERRKSISERKPGHDEETISLLSSHITTSSVEEPDPRSPMRPPKLNVRCTIPSTGSHRHSTVESAAISNKGPNTVPSYIADLAEERKQFVPLVPNDILSETRDHFNPNSLKRNNSRLTKHADLISILSLPKVGNKSIQSARSIRTNRSRLATATITDLMQELASDESKYMRELRTLVDGVIPVLLTCVLSKSDSAVAAGLFQSSGQANDNLNFTRPIVDMGIALERLKKLHQRIPQDDPLALLTWAHGAQRVYTEYLKAWRMGFQDVIVNLAPAAENARGLDDVLPRDGNGDVLNGDGERVDVAFLLKRPLVRLKYLQKTLKGVHFIKPSAEAESLATRYQILVEDARRRSNEERARLEDEAASNIDPTRARDLKSLAPVAGVTINRARRVRARDHFNLALQHSSGQRVDCRVELLLRDEASATTGCGDLLISEVDGTGRWLLFPPIHCGHVSARNGDLKGEIIVMIRGISATGSEWQEICSLQSDDEQAGFEWVQMLGLTPVPPSVSRSQSFLSKYRIADTGSGPYRDPDLELASAQSLPGKSRTPSPREVEVPIGEQAVHASKVWEDAADPRPVSSPAISSSHPLANLPIESSEQLPATPPRLSNYVDQVNDLRSLPSQFQTRETTHTQPSRTPRSFKEALGLSGTSTTVGLKRTRAKRLSKFDNASPSSPKSRNVSRRQESEDPSPPSQPHSSKHGTSVVRDLRSLSPEPGEEYMTNNSPDLRKSTRLPNNRSPSSVPSMKLPYIPKARQNSPPSTPMAEPEAEPKWPSPVVDLLAYPPSKLQKNRPESSRSNDKQKPSPPATPTHRSSSPVQLEGKTTPVLSNGKAKPRRSSSPLKHEYEPSTASESSSDSDASTVERHDATSASDSSDEEELEDGDAPTPLLPLGTFKRVPPPRNSLRMSAQPTPTSTIKPSESASQAPYKTVPPQPTKASKTIASIFVWSESGSWQSLHPDECSVVITPGLIEAYEMSAAHSKIIPPSASMPVIDADAFSDMASNLTSQNDEVHGDRPIVALELTPLVPLRRGTALDISIRSPPTPNSQITSGSNIMFRSRNPEECEALYALINHSRINNPTFIALSNARASSSSFNANPSASTNASGSRRSWFGGFGRSSSYRASTAPTPSIALSESSIGSMSSAFSALRRFGRGSGSGMFNISRSTITSREGGSRANSIYTSSDNSSGSGTSSPVPPGMISAGKDAPIGLSNAKIRLYTRETASRWRDMGSAKLTIMRAERNTNIGPDGRPASSGGHQGGDEKRIVILGKTKGEMLLDVQLGESCFERVARTGIALSVWEDVVGPNGEVGIVNAQGGVVGGRAQVYMIQVRFVVR